MDHVVVVDLGYGDCGKGTTVDGLCSAGPIDTVVRFNSGAQAAHNVVLENGAHHQFRQFGSGTLRGVPTFLSRYVAVEPFRMYDEASILSVHVDPWSMMSIDADCLITTPFHAALNRLAELARGAGAHGSCGLGFGETIRLSLEDPESALRVRDLNDRCTVFDKLEHLFALYAAATRTATPIARLEVGVELLPISFLADAYQGWASLVNVVDGYDHLAGVLHQGRVVFEGAQGVLLDENHGWHPHTTWSTTTFKNADTLLAEHGQEAFHLGVLRAHTTRHGYGPHPTEDPVLLEVITEPHNSHGRWQGPWRTGHFDGPGHRYAAQVAGRVDGLSLTHLDQTPDELKICIAYEHELPDLGHLRGLAYQEAVGEYLNTTASILETPKGSWVDTIEQAIGVPVVIQSHGPTASDKTGLEAI